MKIKIILLSVFVILVTPILSITILSLQSSTGITWEWYSKAFHDAKYIASLKYSFFLSLGIAGLSSCVCFIIALSWYNRAQRAVVLLVIVVLGLMPPDIVSLSITRSFQLFGIYGSSMGGLIFGLLLYVIPYGVLILWGRLYFIEKILITAARDLGLRNKAITLKIILPLSAGAISSCAILSFLLCFNEYPRTYYLSGTDEYLSEYVNGALSAGTDASIYAEGAISIFISVFAIVGIAIYHYRRKKSKQIAPRS